MVRIERCRLKEVSANRGYPVSNGAERDTETEQMWHNGTIMERLILVKMSSVCLTFKEHLIFRYLSSKHGVTGMFVISSYRDIRRICIVSG